MKRHKYTSFVCHRNAVQKAYSSKISIFYSPYLPCVLRCKKCCDHRFWYAKKAPIWEFFFALKVLDHNAFYGKTSSHMLGFFCMSRSLVFTFLHCATLVHEWRIFVSFHLFICKNNTYWLVDNIVGCINFLYIASYVLCKNSSAIHKLISIIFMNRQMK